MPAPRLRPSTALDPTVFGVGLAVLLVLAALAPIGSTLSIMVVGSCDGRCDFAVMRTGQAVYAAGPFVALVGSAVGGGLLRARRRRRRWWIPIAGIALALGLVQLGGQLVLSGVPAR